MVRWALSDKYTILGSNEIMIDAGYGLKEFF
jgi:hypothetical protein